jgi:hypothetical protein
MWNIVGIAYNGSKGLGVWIRCVGGSVVHRTKGFDGYFGDSRVRGAQIHWLTIPRSGFQMVLGCFGCSTRLVSSEVDILISVSFIDFRLYCLKKRHRLPLVAGSSRYVDRFCVDGRFIRLIFLGLQFCLLGWSRSWFILLFYTLLWRTGLGLCPPSFCIYFFSF